MELVGLLTPAFAFMTHPDRENGFVLERIDLGVILIVLDFYHSHNGAAASPEVLDFQSDHHIPQQQTPFVVASLVFLELSRRFSPYLQYPLNPVVRPDEQPFSNRPNECQKARHYRR